MFTIRDLEKPKGCIKVLAHLTKSQPMCISEIMRSAGLSQGVVYSSLVTLRELDVARRLQSEPIRGRASLCTLTEWGCRLGYIVLAIIDTVREISGRFNIDPYLTMPAGSFSVLVHIYRNGSITPGDTVSKLALCSGSATSALRELRRLGLVYFRKKKRFRRTEKVYRLTEDGEYLASYLDIVDMALQWKGGR